MSPRQVEAKTVSLGGKQMRHGQKNVARDKVVMDQLKEQGIRSLVIWECTVRQMCRDTVRETEVIDEVEKFFFSETGQLEL